MKVFKKEAETEIMMAARQIHDSDASRSRTDAPKQFVPPWDELPAHQQAHYIRRAANALGLPLQRDLEVA